MATYTAHKITDTVYWVGANDWDLRDFHGYLTDRGTSYNAFLIIDEKITLIDTVKKPFRDEMMQRIASVTEPEKIDYIVSLHAEMDHSGCLPETIKACQPDKIFASKAGVDALEQHFQIGELLTTVKEESISLGSMNLQFIMTRMLHWPDSMIAHLDSEEILFTQDAFGMHVASDERYTDELPAETIRYQAAKYFANILTPYSKLILKAVQKLRDSGLSLKMIAPDHGPIWREEPTWILDHYEKWAEQKPTEKAIVIYDTMWKSTEQMAHAVCEGLHQGGARPKLMGLAQNHRSDIATEILAAGAFLVGSPTLNNQYLPLVADSMVYLKGLEPKNLVGGVFGSYGWKAAAIKNLEADFEQMGIECPAESLAVKYVPTEDDFEACRDFGKTIAEALLARLEG